MLEKRSVWRMVGIVAVLAAATCAVFFGVRSSTAIPKLALPAPGMEWDGSVAFDRSPELEAAMALLPREVMVYRYVDHMVTEEDVRRVADLTGLADVEMRTEAYGYWVETGTPADGLQLTCFGNEAWTFQVLGEAIPGAIPDEATARAIAEKELARLGLPMEHMAYVVCGEEGGSDGVTAIDPIYQLSLDGVPDEGCMKAMVTVGSGGKILGWVYLIRPVEPFKTMPLRSAEEALAEALRGEGAYAMPDNAVSAVVSGAHVACRSVGAPIQEQPYLLPAYFFEGTALTKEGTSEHFRLTVPAL